MCNVDWVTREFVQIEREDDGVYKKKIKKFLDEEFIFLLIL